ncbi:MAG TPA: NUDIX hydrolase [Elusimicrobiota bacterium]|nr:NUDIX hydrolase [Elusimicrobiota bacterium]
MKKTPAGRRKKVPGEAVEVSAGGLVLGDGKLLMVKVRNLEGRVVWTFPKGHLEKGETAEDAALREVREETGRRCRLRRPFGKVHYEFYRNGKHVRKTVHWFLMEPLETLGEPDPEEVLDCRWFSWPESAEVAVYPSDKKILARLKKSSEVKK